MGAFSASSLDRLRSCDSRLQELFNEIVKTYDCSILDGFRGRDEQDAAFRARRSNKQWPDSKHNQYPSRAVDAAPYPIRWEETKRFYHFAGYVKAKAEALGIPLRWGGDWDGDLDFSDQSFNDLVHFELV